MDSSHLLHHTVTSHRIKSHHIALQRYGLSWGVPGWIGNQSTANTPGRNSTLFFTEDNIVYHVRWVQGLKKYYNVSLDWIGTNAIFRNSRTLLESKIFGYLPSNSSVPSTVLSRNASFIYVPIYADNAVAISVTSCIHQRHLERVPV